VSGEFGGEVFTGAEGVGSVLDATLDFADGVEVLVDFLSVLCAEVPAAMSGRMASRAGRARVAPRPLRNVRRSRCQRLVWMLDMSLSVGSFQCSGKGFLTANGLEFARMKTWAAGIFNHGFHRWHG